MVLAIVILAVAVVIGLRLSRPWFAGTGSEQWPQTARTLSLRALHRLVTGLPGTRLWRSRGSDEAPQDGARTS